MNIVESTKKIQKTTTSPEWADFLEKNIDLMNHRNLSVEEVTSLMRDVAVGKDMKARLKMHRNNISLSDRENYKELIEKGEKAIHELCIHHQRLVFSIAKRYSELPPEDIFQFGNIGLLKAIDKFDHNRNVQLITYATWWVRQVIRREIDNTSRTIRVPAWMSDRIRLIYRFMNQHLVANGKEADIEDIMIEFSFTRKQAEQAMDIINRNYEISYEDLLDDSGDENFSQHYSQLDLSMDDLIISSLNSEEVDEIGLTDSEKYVLQLRYYHDLSYKKIGECFEGKGRGYAINLHDKALIKIRNAFGITVEA